MRRSSCKIPIISVVFERKFNFLGRFSKNIQIINFNENRYSGGPSSLRMDRRTDMTTVIVAFHNFANTPKNALGKGIGK